MVSVRSTEAIWAVALLAAGCGPAPRPVASPPPPPATVQPVAIAAPSPAAAQEQPAELQQASGQTQSSGQFEVGPSSGRPSRQGHTDPVHVLALGVTLKKKWQSRVGRTTFRTTMALVGGRVVIGTHGRTLKGKNERDDGVYVLDAKTGKRVRLIRTPGHGDLDVGGVAIDGQSVVFSTDNSQIVKAELGGKVLWKARAKGKVRPAPALADLDGDGDLDVVVGDESGMLRALDGKSGKRLWAVATGGNDYGAKGFIGAAAVADLDGDGHPDVVAGARDGILSAYRGTDGGVLWQIANSSGIHASPLIADFDQDGHPEVLAAWSYGDVAIADGRTGEKRWATRLAEDSGGIEGLFGTPTPLPGAPGVLIAPTSWWGKEDGILGVGVDERRFKAFEGRVSASAVVTDLANDGKPEAILGTEAGELVALTADGGRALLAKLGGPIEAPAMLADTDGDGTYELLVASNDGKLTCFETGSTKKPFISRFRGESLHNTGVIGATKLGWQSQRQGMGAPAASRGGASRGGIRVDYLRCCKALTDQAARAPTPQNKRYLEAASVCNSLAGLNTDRSKALASVRAVLRGAGVPRQCR